MLTHQDLQAMASTAVEGIEAMDRTHRLLAVVVVANWQGQELRFTRFACRGNESPEVTKELLELALEAMDAPPAGSA